MRSSYLLNHRQRAIVSHALRHPGHHYTIASHRRSHNVVYQTARTDLMGLVEKGLFQVSKRGKTQYFLARQSLEKRLGSLR